MLSAEGIAVRLTLGPNGAEISKNISYSYAGDASSSFVLSNGSILAYSLVEYDTGYFTLFDDKIRKANRITSVDRTTSGFPGAVHCYSRGCFGYATPQQKRAGNRSEGETIAHHPVENRLVKIDPKNGIGHVILDLSHKIRGLHTRCINNRHPERLISRCACKLQLLCDSFTNKKLPSS